MSRETGRHQPRFVGLGEELLDGFDVADEESRDFLGSLIASGRVPSDAMAEVADFALMRGQEEWDMMMACAASMRGRTDPASRDHGRLLGCLRALLGGRGELVWQDVVPDSGTTVANVKRTRKPARNVSRFWDASFRPDERLSATHGVCSKPEPTALVADESGQTEQQQDELSVGEPVLRGDSFDSQVLWDIAETEEPPTRPKIWVKSPFFTTPSRSTKHNNRTPPTSPSTKKTRPRAGTVSGLPIPPLSAPRFGLIQEELTHDPFGLLVAVTLLIKTSGKLAIPTFRALKARFPDPASLAAADPDADVIPMIRHLGLATRRCAALQRYARSWVARPPTRAVRFGVKNYPCPGDARDVQAGEEFGPEDQEFDLEGPLFEEEDQQENEDLASAARTRRGRGCAWEVGHVVQGRYAIDSWRIFCRDIMLGRAEDWTGKGESRDGFQPEWMRVLPQDKELKACLRWMWMKEGWVWDPETGDREVLGEELRLAVDEGRVKYDDVGNLVISESGT